MAKRFRFVIGAIVCTLLTPFTVHADTVLDWNEIAVNSAISAAQNPFFQARTNAMVQVAVFEAVNAITKEYEPYLGVVTAPSTASADAAAAQAAYRVLRTLLAASAPTVAALDTAIASTLSGIPNGQPKTDGIAAGEWAAAEILALRANDGSLPLAFKTPGAVAVGEWQATPSCPLVAGVASGILFQWKNITPFAIPTPWAFMPPPPPGVTTSQYAKDLAEVASVGLDTSKTRPADRTLVAQFYAASSPSQLFGSALRQVAAAKGRSLSDNARSLALMAMAINDALIVSFNTKYHYNFWRPETAIRGAATDGNNRTDANPTFKPFITTPCFPSYPSNHASGSGAGAEALRRLYGADGHSIDLTHPSLPGVTMHYSGFHEIVDDVDDARVFGGIHFRFDQDGGNVIGREVATYVVKNYLQPVHPAP
jgi:hypothetical protein